MTKRLCPINYYGGKMYMLNDLYALFPRHDIWVDVFGGGGSVTLNKRPSNVEVYNDIYHALYDFFSVLADTELYEQFIRRVAVLPYSRELYNECRANWRTESDRVKRVAMWFTMQRQSFSGRGDASWSYIVTQSSKRMAGSVAGWLSAIDGLPAVHQRLQRVQIENQDFKKIIKTYDTPKTLFYLDPPYVPDSRKSGSGNVYAHEMTVKDHERLLCAITQMEGMAVLSGYANELYDSRLIDWERKEKKTVCHAAGRTRCNGLQGEGNLLRKQQRVEVIWCNAAAIRNRVQTSLLAQCERGKMTNNESVTQRNLLKGDGNGRIRG